MTSLLLTFLLIALALLGHGYLWIAIINRLHGWAGPRRLIDGLTWISFIAFLAIPVGIAGVWSRGESLAAATAHFEGENRASLAAIYLWGSALWGLVKLLLLPFEQRRRDRPDVLLSRDRELAISREQTDRSHYVGLKSRVLSLVPGNQTLQLALERKTLAIPGLSPAHAGLTIAHVSDFHMTGCVDVGYFEQVVDHVNAAGADLICITGDIVEEENCWPWLEQTLGKLSAPLGVFFIVGNHDVYVDVAETKQLLCNSGLHCVSETSVTLQYHEEPILLAGNELPWIGDKTCLEKTLQKHPDPALRILLAHCPDQFPWACQQGFDLVLAGHTHGGQIRFPLLEAVACPSLHGTKYASGVFRSGNTVMHVTRGISGETPLRWRCAPEIALVKLEQPKPR